MFLQGWLWYIHQTTRYSSDFTKNFGKYTKVIHYAHSRIPELEATSSSIKWSISTTAINLFTQSQHQKLYNVNIIEDNIDRDDLDTTDYALSDNGYTNPNDSDTEENSSASIIPAFVEGDNLIYCRDGHVEIMILQLIIYSND